MEPFLKKIETDFKNEFSRNNRLLTFDEYLSLILRNPEQQLRSSAQYCVDMMDYFGHDETHFKVFDQEFADPNHCVIGQGEVQQEIYRCLKNFTKEGVNNKLILLHGPNGSAKSSIVTCLIRGLEKYSELAEGAIYRFHWIFPVEKVVKGNLGLASYKSEKEPMDSYARLAEDEIAAKITCDLKDHPLLLIPAEGRSGLFGKRTTTSEYLKSGSLCHKCKQIFDSLLNAYKGDLKKVLMHVQVERFYISKRYRNSAVTIEPQMHVDAQTRQITMDRSLGHLPPSLQSLSLYELSGDLIDANRGLVEYSDLLKRPVDMFKYLLGACETGSVNVGSSIAFLDSIFIGSTNELQMDAFKEFPDFTSFKARIELIRVPYLLKYSSEKRIYDLTISKIAGDKHVTPHTTFVTALWAVLSRLKKPNAIHYPPQLTNIVGALSPIEKSKYYDHGWMPQALSAEERKLLKAAEKKLREEYTNVPYYEGRTGASAREMKAILHDVAHNPEFYCVSPLGLFKELDEFVKRVSEYEFLKQDVKDGYHDNFAFINVAKNEYLNVLNQEVREAMGVFESKQYEDFLKKYILHLSHVLKKEKIKNTITGRPDSPDMGLLEEFESIVDAPRGANERDIFRNNVISAIGAYALDHPNQPMDYRKVFPDFMQKLEDHYFNQQKAQMVMLRDAVLLFHTEKDDPSGEHHKLARRTIDTMVTKYRYCEKCAEQCISFLVKSRY